MLGQCNYCGERHVSIRSCPRVGRHESASSSVEERQALTLDDEGSSPSSPTNEMEASMSDPENEFEFRRRKRRDPRVPADDNWAWWTEDDESE